MGGWPISSWGETSDKGIDRDRPPVETIVPADFGRAYLP